MPWQFARCLTDGQAICKMPVVCTGDYLSSMKNAGFLKLPVAHTLNNAVSLPQDAPAKLFRPLFLTWLRK